MGGPDLRVDTDVLRSAGTNLRQVGTAFERAETYADEYAQNCGDSGLRSALYGFADSWDEHRKDIRSAIEGLGKFAQQAAGAYEELETEFVNALLGKGK